MRTYGDKSQKAFTLVELAIVMTIIGLLIGGILKGQELLENARVTSTIAQIKSYEAAMTAFSDIYDALPGDLPNAGDKIPGCNQNCTPYYNPDSTDGTAGDGFVSEVYSDGSGMVQTRPGVSNPPDAAINESYLMWVHLLKANLVTGVTDAAINGEVATRSFGTTDPAAKAGGGFWVGTNIGAQMVGNASGYFSLVLGSSLSAGLDELNDHTQVLTPARAAQIDRKIDDGRPRTGNVWGQAMPTVTAITRIMNITSKPRPRIAT